MGALATRKSKLTDIAWIIERMSEEDRHALACQDVKEIHEAFKLSMFRSVPQAYTACEVLSSGIENPVAAFGVVPTPIPGDARRVGQIWCVATEYLRTNRWREFTAGSIRFLDGLMKQWDMLYNVESSDSETHLRWLKRCGFQMLKTVPYGPKGLPFVQFVRFA